ncbi:Zn-dependent peptidase ImmA (M78 family) [Streptomyces sp. 846.5]|nr:ImmA/IrrE family metallo-endopeptidase [Streptomyces sp. 846.5]TDT95573.1 Zn-dependent peptidase ImmA (M78 family) [Streptomyces sp. 846.5]
MSSNESRAQQLAEGFRAEQRLEDAPIKDMFELVHAARGIDVLSIDAPDAEHGLSMTDPSTGRTVIAVATTPHPMRQRSSVAHELGHVLAGDLDGEAPLLLPGGRSSAEICADAFARHLLLPLGAVRRRLPKGASVSQSDLSALVQEFEVSPHLAAIQLRTAGLIDAEVCTDWGRLSAAHLATTFGWLSQYNSLAVDSTAPRAPQSLMTRAVEGYQRGVLGITELAAWYQQDPAILEDELGHSRQVEAGEDWQDEWDQDAPLFPSCAEAGDAAS